MPKAKVTRKFITENFNTVISVPYCALQTVLNYRSPSYYCTNSYGWACDIYEVAPNTAIVTGYAPFGKWKIPYEAYRTAEEQAIGKTEDEREGILAELLNHLAVNK